MQARSTVQDKRRRRGLAALSLLLGLSLALVLAEIVWRTVEPGWLSDLAARNYADPEVHAESPGAGRLYQLTPGAEFIDTEREPASINSWGCRDRPRVETAGNGTYRILVVGGSNTYGGGVAAAETWPAQLERVLAENLDREVEVWNCGVSGYQLHQKVAFAAELLPRIQPDAILVQVHNLGPRYLLPETEVRPVLERSPDLLADWVPALATKRWLAGPLVRSPLHLATFPVLFHGVRTRTLEKDGRPPNGLLLPGWEAGLAVLADFADQHGDRPIIVVIPPPGLARKAPAFRTALDASGLTVLDLSLESFPEYLFEIREIHPGRQVYSWYGKTLARQLLAPACPAAEAPSGVPCLPGLLLP
ncbi:MAG: hypothetical protein VX498_15830 [Myxococcota bacterium]|nr:hypothetical protein [Myxococcota bacterium]